MSGIYKKGNKDPYIALIQRALNEIMKLSLVTDGDFGAKTEAALRSWQQSLNFPVTGTHSGTGAQVLDSYIAKRFLNIKDFEAAAQKLQTEVACVRAVQDVESRGNGFAVDGSLVLLFERHIFKRQLDAKLVKMPQSSLEKIAVKIGLKIQPGQQIVPAIQSYLLKTQSDIYNTATGGYVGGLAENTRLKKAALIDEEAAYCSASWGLFQIMGFHHKLLGYPSALEMVKHYADSERNQLLSFCDFVLADANLTKAIRAKDWASFAKGYNGPAYAKNQYDVKMAAAYKKYAA